MFLRISSATKITSLQHPVIKHCVKLKDKKEYREKCGAALVTGIKLIEELSYISAFKTLLVEESYAEKNPHLLPKAEQYFIVSSALLKKVTSLVQPEPLAAEIALPQDADVSAAEYLLILDGVSDPGNMGTLLRTALGLGWQGVLITPHSTDPFNEKALRAAKGATFKIPLKRAAWEEIPELFANGKRTILAADMHGKPLDALSAVSSPLALILGNEARGISYQMWKNAQSIAIPMSSEMESLNVATAGAILMHTLKRCP
ncbi:MAG TPA: RNA methyltransferase [Rhabdochlamydiaceae bacterium]